MDTTPVILAIAAVSWITFSITKSRFAMDEATRNGAFLKGALDSTSDDLLK